MDSINCLKCGKPIYLLNSKPGEVVRCPNCFARHIVPSIDPNDEGWILISKELQQHDDSLYEKWMPWTFRLMMIALLLLYIRLRLETFALAWGPSKLGTAKWATILVTVLLIFSWIATGIWAGYVQYRCYAHTGSSAGNMRARWLIVPLIIAAAVIGLSEILLRFL